MAPRPLGRPPAAIRNVAASYAGTLAEAAELAIETAAIRVRCETCGEETEAAPNRLLCGSCGDWHTRVVSGDELMLMSVELIQNEVQDPRYKIQGK